jgi:hypothetical protein
MKTSTADSYFSKCVRASNDYVCERCKKQYDKSSSGLHCSHNFSRRHRTVRWCKENTLPLCFACHQWFGGEPLESGKWLENYIGIGMVEMLIEKKNSKVKVSKLEEKEISDHYRKELKKIEAKRASGETGVIEFDSYQ